MEINPIKKRSIADQICDQLRAKIISGELQPGDKLPTESELCQLYQVSRTSVRQALANLSTLDLIEAKVGGGTFVKKADGSQVMDKLFFYTFLDEKSLAEIMEFRDLMEPPVTRLACKKARNEDIEKLNHIYRCMEETQNNSEEFAKLDLQFHATIAEISRNPYVIKIYEAMNEILLNAFSKIVLSYQDEENWKYHQQIIEAFQRGDSELAGSIMQQHMDQLLLYFDRESGYAVEFAPLADT